MAFDDWKKEARQRFPELPEAVEESETPYILWSRLLPAFFDAYDRHDESLIRRIYDYSDWCIAQPEGKWAEDDLATCVAVSFYEQIPEHPAARDDMPRWFTLDDLLTMRQTFRANISEEDFEMLKQHFKNAAQ